ncbi:helicase-related protein [Nocardia bovistercoris]|uniref:DEAD/DEAH box helicase n=1 Tax=Nocardia bovistercoris TaxID=2785916 RepID=A0A931IF67_9NOCA|nr:helicase-related protein [Nocardia bovistercoris]MBH0779341.1 DEAD/DEAH box helicase [Nocardia bovistercoris]
MTVAEPSDRLDIAPGSIVVVRDEEWLVTGCATGSDGAVVRVRGLSELVADTTATFYSSLDDIQVLDPARAQVVADGSSGYRDARLWLEALLRKTPFPYGDQTLTVSTHMLADSLEYQRAAVAKALDPSLIRPRILLADAVGLGKTLEIGMILAELVRRGRGDRILVVTPRHVLEQMQHELWCRFALPFVRLDSAGIQKVRQKLPATRNPFTYYKRAIISIDTLKSPRYKAHLARQHWDAVVIDESHNLTNVGTRNNELARLLAPNTEALILASATPHNGKEESFAELLRLLDPTAVAADGSFAKDDVSALVIRRHRHHPEVAAEVGADWAERAEPEHRLVRPSEAEDAVARELSRVWLHPEHGSSPYSGEAKALFPWTLAKAFLSSPAALAESIEQRRRRLGEPGGPETRAELAALNRLAELNDKALGDSAGKQAALVDRLREIGVGPKSPMRAVVFAERIATLSWLTRVLPAELGVGADNVVMLHGGLSDIDQQAIVDSFKLETSPIRVLVTGDVASEGVNLHAQCHHLIHYDIPWSLIRIEQRNGRVDRYGQQHPPVISSLILEPSDPEFSGDLRVLSRLLERENQAHTTLGDVASLMGKHSVSEEEAAIRDVLAGRSTEQAQVREIQDVLEADDFDAYFTQLSLDADAEPTLPEAPRQSLYGTDVEFLEEALRAGFPVPDAAPSAGGVGWVHHAEYGVAELVPPTDLRKRLGLLPQNYVRQGRVLERLKLATSAQVGKSQLRAARRGRGIDETTWPEAHFLGPLHPVLEWAGDRALSALGRNQIFAIRGNLDATTVLLMGTLMNQRGQLVSRVFATVEFPDADRPSFGLVEARPDLDFLLSDTGLQPGTPNPGPIADPERLRPLIPAAVESARVSMALVLTEQEQSARARLARWRARADRWHSGAEQLEMFGARKSTVDRWSRRIAEEQRLAESLAPTQQLVRPLLVIVPEKDQ